MTMSTWVMDCEFDGYVKAPSLTSFGSTYTGSGQQQKSNIHGL